LGFIVAFTGIGLISGPLVGSLLYFIGGYRFLFFSIGTIFIGFSFYVKAMFLAIIDSHILHYN
jgi:hypothetical protein